MLPLDLAKQANFIQTQYRFAAHIRDPDNQPAPNDIDPRRMAVYRELCYNNLESFLSNVFRITREIYRDEAWHAMVRDFFAHYACQSPYFNEIAQEFFNFLQQQRQSTDDPPYLRELAHFEWIELVLETAEEDPQRREQPFHLSSLAIVAQYTYPVHKISAQWQPEQPETQPIFLVMYRDKQDNIDYLRLNYFAARLLDTLRQQPATTMMQLTQQLQKDMPDVNVQQIQQWTTDYIDDFYQRDIILK